jgi:hypothetical protein
MDPTFSAEQPAKTGATYNLYCYRTELGQYQGYVATRNYSTAGPDRIPDKIIFPNIQLPPAVNNRKYKDLHAVLPKGCLEECYDKNTQFAEHPILYTNKSLCSKAKKILQEEKSNSTASI